METKIFTRRASPSPSGAVWLTRGAFLWLGAERFFLSPAQYEWHKKEITSSQYFRNTRPEFDAESWHLPPTFSLNPLRRRGAPEIVQHHRVKPRRAPHCFSGFTIKACKMNGPTLLLPAQLWQHSYTASPCPLRLWVPVRCTCPPPCHCIQMKWHTLQVLWLNGFVLFHMRGGSWVKVLHSM